MQRSVKALVLSAVMALSGFYLWALYLAAHPHISLAYRMYYLELKTLFWNRYQTLAYIPGMSMDLVNERSPYLSRQGWVKPDEKGKGSLLSGPGSLYFSLHRLRGPLRLMGEFTNPSAGTTLTISMGDWSETLVLSDPGAVHFEVTLPATLFVAAPDRVNQIDLQPSIPMYFQSFILMPTD